MSKVGIIVDGPGDFSTLKNRFTNGFKILKTDGPRGHCVTIEAIVAKSRKQINLLKRFDCTKIIILLDFECREIDFDDFADSINQHFSSKITDVKVVACLANTMIENWYLADISYLSSKFVFLRKVKKQKRFEGLHGKKELKKIMKKGQSYNEIKHGALLFKTLRIKEACKYSPSLAYFMNQINI